MTSYTRHFVRNSAIVLTFSLLSAIFGYFTRVFYGRILTIEQFGLLYAVINFIIFLIAFRNFGLNEGLSKFIPEFKVKNKIKELYSTIHFAFWVQTGINTILLGVVFIFAKSIAAHYFNTPDAIPIIRLIIIGFWLNCFTELYTVSFLGNQNMVSASSIQFARSFVILILSVIFFYANLGHMSAVYAHTFFSTVLLIIFTPIFLKKFPKMFHYPLKIEKQLARKIVRYSFPLVIGSMGAIAISFTDTLFLTYLSGLKDVALYNVAWPTGYLLMFLAIAFSSVLLPLVSELWTRKRSDLLALGVAKLYKYFLILILPVALTIIAYAHQIIGLLFTEEFLPASTALIILSAGFVFLNFASLSLTILNGMGLSRASAKIFIIAAVVNIAGNSLLIPFYGFIGAAIATSVCYLVMSVLSILVLRRKIKGLILPLRSWISTLVTGVAFIILVQLANIYLKPNLLTMLGILVFSGAIYILLLFMFRILSVEEAKETYELVVVKRLT